MFSKSIVAILALTTSSAIAANTPQNIDREHHQLRKLSRNKRHDRMEDLTLTVTNLAVRQPFSPFFVMVHDDSIEPLFEFGKEASGALALLAEGGSPADLVDMYSGMDGVLSAVGFMEDAPYVGGESVDIPVTVSRYYPYVTIASMAINTNDCFVAVNGMKLRDGDVVYGNGLDAGSEENNELCESIPGPACAMINGTNVASGEGEGFVHVHPGFFGVGDLSQSRYDWRNPMMEVKVTADKYY